MKILKQEQYLPIGIKEAWEFFSTPKNLNEITPEDMTFKIIGDIPDSIYEGLFIRYKVSPLLNIPMDWVTEITHVKDFEYFVDEQRLGPYKIWHHEHLFFEQGSGVRMVDLIHYHVGMGIFGKIAEKWVVEPKVKHIFSYRNQKLKQLFPFAEHAEPQSKG